MQCNHNLSNTDLAYMNSIANCNHTGYKMVHGTRTEKNRTDCQINDNLLKTLLLINNNRPLYASLSTLLIRLTHYC